MSQVYPVPQNIAERTYLNNEAYLAMYDQSVNDPDTF